MSQVLHKVYIRVLHSLLNDASSGQIFSRWKCPCYTKLNLEYHGYRIWLMAKKYRSDREKQ